MAEYQFANTTVTISSNAVAKVTNLRMAYNVQEIETTGAEDVSGVLVDEKYVPVAVGQTLELEGILMSNTGLTGIDILEDAQESLHDAARAGTSVTLEVRLPITPAGGVVKGWDLVGHFTGFNLGGGVKDVYKWSGTFRVNTETEVLN